MAAKIFIDATPVSGGEKIGVGLSCNYTEVVKETKVGIATMNDRMPTTTQRTNFARSSTK